jgi:adenosine deaminase
MDACVAEFVMPLILGSGRRSELLDVELDGRGAVNAERFDLPLAEPCQPLIWLSPSGSPLQREIQEREKAGSRLFGNFIEMLSKNEHHENWRSLYRLPPGMLRETRLAEGHRAFIERIPKADLHRHLGGSLDIPAQRRVAQTIWDELTARAKNTALEKVQAWLRSGHWPADWPDSLRSGGMRLECSVALLVKASDEQLERNLYGTTRPRLALKGRLGFAAYERPGELSGAALLSHRAALKPYVQEVVRQAREEGLSYVELRGSPHKYVAGNGMDFLRRLDDALQLSTGTIENQRAALILRFIVIGDRRKPESLADVVRMTVRAKSVFPDLIAGLDLAGDEGASHPVELAACFEPAFEACLPLTLCTDNPGISRTTIPDEFLVAARMTDPGISLWETLAIIKQGFSHAFLPSQAREDLIREMDVRVYRIVLEESQQLANLGVYP